VHGAFESSRWVTARPGEADTLFQIASVSSALRVVRRSLPTVVPEVDVVSHVDPAWLADDPRALAHRGAAVALLEGSAEVSFVSVTAPGAAEVVAKGRVARGSGAVPGDEDWAGITNVWVSPGQRRSGLGTVVMEALLSWAAERGATTAYLQVRGDNPSALAAYDRLGLRTGYLVTCGLLAGSLAVFGLATERVSAALLGAVAFGVFYCAIIAAQGIWSSRVFPDHPAAGLSYGTLKRVELARAVLQRPRLLMLDEPASGLNHAEVSELAALIRELRDDLDLTVLLVEHNMGMVMDLCDHVVVLDVGRKIAAGEPRRVQEDDRVIQAYLGTPA